MELSCGITSYMPHIWGGSLLFHGAPNDDHRVTWSPTCDEDRVTALKLPAENIQSSVSNARDKGRENICIDLSGEEAMEEGEDFVWLETYDDGEEAMKTADVQKRLNDVHMEDVRETAKYASASVERSLKNAETMRDITISRKTAAGKQVGWLETIDEEDEMMTPKRPAAANSTSATSSREEESKPLQVQSLNAQNILDNLYTDKVTQRKRRLHANYGRKKPIKRETDTWPQVIDEDDEPEEEAMKPLSMVGHLNLNDRVDNEPGGSVNDGGCYDIDGRLREVCSGAVRRKSIGELKLKWVTTACPDDGKVKASIPLPMDVEQDSINVEEDARKRETVCVEGTDKQAGIMQGKLSDKGIIQKRRKSLRTCQRVKKPVDEQGVRLTVTADVHRSLSGREDEDRNALSDTSRKAATGKETVQVVKNYVTRQKLARPQTTDEDDKSKLSEPLSDGVDRSSSNDPKQRKTTTGVAARGKKPQTCPDCNKVFQFVSQLRNHRLIHSVERPFRCTRCDAGFKRISHLQTHMKFHENARKFKCDTCDKTFNLAHNLYTHSLVHIDEKPHVCSVCSKSFRLKIHLKQHKMTHSGEKPFACFNCGKNFTQRCHLRNHMRTHSGERPYPCKMCDKRFADTSNLRRHTLSHTGEKPFECSVCNKRFSMKKNLNRHVSKIHRG